MRGGKMEGGLWLGNREGDYLKIDKINYYETFDNQQTPSGWHERSCQASLRSRDSRPGESENSCHRYRQLLADAY